MAREIETLRIAKGAQDRLRALAEEVDRPRAWVTRTLLAIAITDPQTTAALRQRAKEEM